MILEVGPCFENPVGLDDEKGDDEDTGSPCWEEWTDFEPCDEVVDEV